MKTKTEFVFGPKKCLVRYQGQTLAKITPGPDADPAQFAIICHCLALTGAFPLIREHDETKP